MLKPTGDHPRPDGDASLGELASQLLEDAKAYARAEIELVKAIAADKSRSLVVAAMLFGAALLVAIGAISALSVAIFIALALQIGPVWGGLVTFIIVSAVAGLIGWLGWRKLQDAL